MYGGERQSDVRVLKSHHKHVSAIHLLRVIVLKLAK